MEFFVTIVICKIVSCRLMILYTQYSPKSVFHLQTSEMVLFVTITITNNCWLFLLDNDVVRTICSYEFLDFYVSSLLNPSRSRWFQVVPGGSSSFMVFPACSRWFQLVPRFSMFVCFSIWSFLHSSVTTDCWKQSAVCYSDSLIGKDNFHIFQFFKKILRGSN